MSSNKYEGIQFSIQFRRTQEEFSYKVMLKGLTYKQNWSSGNFTLFSGFQE